MIQRFAMLADRRMNSLLSVIGLYHHLFTQRIDVDMSDGDGAAIRFRLK